MREKKAVSVETYVFLAVLIVGVTYFSVTMGVSNFFGTMMATSYSLLIDTVFFIMAISVVTGAVAGLLSEFGVIALLNKLISPLMGPIYNLPGAASVGMMTTFISDNPAILSLAKNPTFARYFKDYQLPALCNLGTAFGMGLIVITYMIGLGAPGVLSAAGIGFIGACIGSVISVRLMLRSTRKSYHISKEQRRADVRALRGAKNEMRQIGSRGLERVLNAILEGGKTGVTLGLDMIPGVLIICTFVMMLTNGMPAGGYTGGAYEGVALLPKLGELIAPVTRLLFGFEHATNIAFPITSLGSTGAALALVPKMISAGTAGMNEVAVYTAMGMCWSGYLSTHISMMDALGKRQFIRAAIGSHTIGGLCAGISAHYLYLLFHMIAG